MNVLKLAAMGAVLGLAVVITYVLLIWAIIEVAV